MSTQNWQHSSPGPHSRSQPAELSACLPPVVWSASSWRSPNGRASTTHRPAPPELQATAPSTASRSETKRPPNSHPQHALPVALRRVTIHPFVATHTHTHAHASASHLQLPISHHRLLVRKAETPVCQTRHEIQNPCCLQIRPLEKTKQKAPEPTAGQQAQRHRHRTPAPAPETRTQIERGIHRTSNQHLLARSHASRSFEQSRRYDEAFHRNNHSRRAPTGPSRIRGFCPAAARSRKSQSTKRSATTSVCALHVVSTRIPGFASVYPIRPSIHPSNASNHRPHGHVHKPPGGLSWSCTTSTRRAAPTLVVHATPSPLARTPSHAPTSTPGPGWGAQPVGTHSSVHCGTSPAQPSQARQRQRARA